MSPLSGDSIKRPDGRMQVSYNGLALYRDVYDKSSGQVNGQGQDRSWFAVTPAGKVTAPWSLAWNV